MAELSGTNEQVLAKLRPLVTGSEQGEQGVEALAGLIRAAAAAGVPETQIKLDVAIARGLDYYTGMVYETFLDDLPTIGSVCSGGRYDDLAGLYTSQELPGIGASLGLDRLLAAMEELGLVDKVATAAEVFIPLFAKDRLHDYLRLAAELRFSGFGVELFPDADKRLGKQLQYADRRGFRIALVLGDDEFNSQTCKLKDLAAKEESVVSLQTGLGDLVAELRRKLDGVMSA
jgi:histidyl-tRNA synthetase